MHRSFTRAVALALVLTALLPAGLALARSSDAGPTIVGGTAARSGAYPWMAALIALRPGNDYDNQFCGATLIRRQWVLTAAHCVAGQSTATLKVVIGRTYLSSGAGESHRVDRIVIHPRYSSRVIGKWDVALVHLRTASTRHPLPLVSTGSSAAWAAGKAATAIGWGNTCARSGAQCYPDRLRVGALRIVSDRTCELTYGRYAIDQIVCAGARAQITCDGDSGGPLVVAGATGPVLAGVTSFGTSGGCGYHGAPSGFSQVGSAPLRTWIDATAPA